MRTRRSWHSCPRSRIGRERGGRHGCSVSARRVYRIQGGVVTRGWRLGSFAGVRAAEQATWVSWVRERLVAYMLRLRTAWSCCTFYNESVATTWWLLSTRFAPALNWKTTAPSVELPSPPNRRLCSRWGSRHSAASRSHRSFVADIIKLICLQLQSFITADRFIVPDCHQRDYDNVTSFPPNGRSLIAQLSSLEILSLLIYRIKLRVHVL